MAIALWVGLKKGLSAKAVVFWAAVFLLFGFFSAYEDQKQRRVITESENDHLKRLLDYKSAAFDSLSSGARGSSPRIITTGSNSPAAITTGNNSPVNLYSGIQLKDLPALLKAFADQEVKTESEALAKEFPLGYAIFGITTTDRVIPFYGEGKELFINWPSAKFYVQDERIILVLPDIVIKSASELVAGTIVVLPRSEGANLTLGFGPGGNGNWLRGNLFAGGPGPQENYLALPSNNPTTALVIRVIKLSNEGEVVLMGFKVNPFQSTPPRSTHGQ